MRIEDVELLIHPCVENACMDARVSELRVVELLDGLCTKMKEYTLNSVLPQYNSDILCSC